MEAELISVRVRYFAVLRDRAGVGEEPYETDAVTVRALVEELIVNRSLGLPSPLVRAALNGQFAADDDPITEGDELVLLPPVAGG